MTSGEDFRPLVAALLYVVQFQRDPPGAVSHALQQTVERGALGASPERYLAAVRAALASDQSLATLIPQDHSEETVRAFLGAVEQRLAGTPS
ncbi:MAG: hypothetical protein WKG00_37985 [Polyangiaceae bacterium]